MGVGQRSVVVQCFRLLVLLPRAAKTDPCCCVFHVIITHHHHLEAASNLVRDLRAIRVVHGYHIEVREKANANDF